MVIMTARESELARSPHAGRLMESRESLALAAVELPPLTDEEMNEVVTALATDAPIPPAVRQAMLRAANGIPMLAELLFDDWRNNGEQCLALSVGAMTVDALGHAEDEMYRRVFDRVFRELSPAARAVVNLAAILGDRLNDLAMYELVDLTLAQTLAGMSELAALRILRDGGREVEFRNELLRNYTYLNVPSPLRRALHSLIADRLLRAEANGEKVPGLMLAWHSFRAGRPVEAEPYLMRGSSEALRRGGVFEVELALTSAMPTLTAPSSREARLLLAEALQEQNRNREALQLVENCRTEDRSSFVRAQIIRARALADIQPQTEEAQISIAALEELLIDESARSKWPAILHVMSQFSWHLGGRSPAKRYLSHAKRISIAQLGLEDRATLEYSLAFLTWMAGDREDLVTAEHRATKLIEECKRDGLNNLATWHLCVGASVLLTSKGAYKEALGCTVTAYDIAAKLGNDAKMSSAALNRAVCELRLGDYARAAYWAEKAGSHARAQEHTWRRVQPAYYWGLSHCMLGENRKALEAVDIIGSASGETAPEWCLQVGPLMAADLLWASGDRARAINSARDGLNTRGIHPILDSFSGMFGRWIGLTAIGTASADAAALELNRLSDELDVHDLVDRAEIISTRLTVDRSRGVAWDDGRSQLSEVLAQLPPAIECQLQRLGMFDF